MESNQTSLEHTEGSSFQIVAFAATAAVTATLVGIATYLYFLKRASSSPQQFLDRCRHAIDNIEHGMNNAGYA